jgi:hypothetical protein
MTRNISRLLMLLTAGSALAGTASAATVLLFDTALVSPPGVYYGNGNSNANFTVSEDGVTELGLSVILRYVGPLDPGAGSNIYTVPTGSAPPPHTGSAWGFTFSVNTQYNGGTAILGNFRYTLKVTDLTTGNVGPTSDPVRSIGDDTGFGPGGKTAGVNLSTEWGVQNSEPASSSQFLSGFNPSAPDLYQITLSQTSLDGLTVLGSVSIFANATGSAIPEPTTFGLIGLGLVTFACALRKTEHTLTD